MNYLTTTKGTTIFTAPKDGLYIVRLINAAQWGENESCPVTLSTTGTILGKDEQSLSFNIAGGYAWSAYEINLTQGQQIKACASKADTVGFRVDLFDESLRQKRRNELTAYIQKIQSRLSQMNQEHTDTIASMDKQISDTDKNVLAAQERHDAVIVSMDADKARAKSDHDARIAEMVKVLAANNERIDAEKVRRGADMARVVTVSNDNKALIESSKIDKQKKYDEAVAILNGELDRFQYLLSQL